jgi:hypothetical protein
VAGELNVIVGELAELAVIHANLLLGGGGTEGQTGDEVHEEQDDAGEDEGPGEAGEGTGDLVAELDEVAVNPADGVVLLSGKTGDPRAVSDISFVFKNIS